MKNHNRPWLCLCLLAVFTCGCQNKQETQNIITTAKATGLQNADNVLTDSVLADGALTDTADYNRRMLVLRNSNSPGKWINKTPYPLPGAILPYKRVVAFYGNLYSKRMGILGELPKDKMLKKLSDETAQWNLADPDFPAVPALHYIAITAQSKPGKNNKYRQRMPFRHIDTVVAWANSINGVVFLDVQVGQSTVKEEVGTLIGYLELPNIHLAIDPEFAMKNGEVPGTKIGTLSASEINEAIKILAAIVKEHSLPPKILVVHRFTRAMVTDYQKIITCPEVQVVMNMDGFGSKALKRSTYHMAIYHEPVQFAGFKLFFKNDTKGGESLYSPQEILQLTPKPIYIQYQ